MEKLEALNTLEYGASCLYQQGQKQYALRVELMAASVEREGGWYETISNETFLRNLEELLQYEYCSLYKNLQCQLNGKCGCTSAILDINVNLERVREDDGDSECRAKKASICFPQSGIAPRCQQGTICQLRDGNTCTNRGIGQEILKEQTYGPEIPDRNRLYEIKLWEFLKNGVCKCE